MTELKKQNIILIFYSMILGSIFRPKSAFFFAECFFILEFDVSFE